MDKLHYLILSHRYVSNPADSLKEHLQSKGEDFLYIYHSFPEAKDRRSYFALYIGGKLVKSRKTIDYIFLPEALVYLKEFFFTSLWLFLYGRRIKKAICLDGLCVNFLLIWKKLGWIKKICYWGIDFVPYKRFESGLKIWVYHRINKLAYKQADEMWDIAPRMKEGREKFINFPQNGYRLHKVVPYGCWVKQFPFVDYHDSLKYTLVFMGHLIPKQGVDQVIEATPRIVQNIPNFKFRVIGGGKYLNQLKEKAKKLKVEKQIDFMGEISDHQQLEKLISECPLSIAPYNPVLDNWTYFANPGKVKVCIACGVPILVSDIVFHANKIVNNQCGEIVRCDKNEIALKVTSLLKNEKKLIEYKKNCLKYAMTFNWTEIFDEALGPR